MWLLLGLSLDGGPHFQIFKGHKARVDKSASLSPIEKKLQLKGSHNYSKVKLIDFSLTFPWPNSRFPWPKTSAFAKPSWSSMCMIRETMRK